MKKIVLIDTHAIIHRAYHALPPLSTPSGEPINAAYGFTSIMLRIMRELKPDYIAAAFDLPGPTFRHEVYEKYKAHRPETPQDLASQFSKVRDVLEAFKIPVFEKEGYEADDIIGTIAHKLGQSGVEIVIVTGDADLLQLVCPGLSVCAMKRGISDTLMYDEDAVQKRFGFEPSRLVDFKALKGDPSDNIPGVKGIGEKTALELIKKFGSLEEIYATLSRSPEEFSPAVARRLREGEKNARLSKHIATIRTDAPFSFSLDDALRRDLDTVEVRSLFQKLGFSSLLKRLNNTEEKAIVQPTLLSDTQKSASPVGTIHTAEEFDAFIKKQRKEARYGIVLLEKEFFLIADRDQRVAKIEESVFRTARVKNFFCRGSDFFAYDGKVAIRFLRMRGIEIAPLVFDVMLAAYITNIADRDFSFLTVSGRELGCSFDDPCDALPRFFETARALESKLSVATLKNVFYKIELPLAPVLAGMEDRGILIDAQALKKLGGSVAKEIDAVTKDIHVLAGETFNISSSQQLSQILFQKLDIASAGLRKTKKNRVISTRESELEKLKDAHPIIKKVLRYRELTKLKTTYIDVLPVLADENTGRIHTTFNQIGASTGRLSSSSPNLQNIPVMSEYGREIRKAFIASPGFVLVSFDYSQIELRVVAHLANDKKMIEAFMSGADIHALTASEVYGKPIGEITPDLRRAAKTLNFGVLYGMGPQAFSEATGMPIKDAREFIARYFKNFSGVSEYILRTKEFVMENGYVETVCGRRRYIPEINSPNWQVKREAERMAINMPVQGTAADLVKMAMISIDRWIREKKIGDYARMLLQVHDELVFEINEKKSAECIPKIKELMEGIAEFNVPLKVEISQGKNWGK